MEITPTQLIGLIGGLCFAYCGVPAAYQALKDGLTRTPVVVAWMICIGGVLMYTYLTIQHGFDWVLAVNYTVEVTSWAIVVLYHYYPREQ
jgi:hypothetical protein